MEHTDKLVGKGADESFVQVIKDMADNHHKMLMPDEIRAYFFGQKYFVELEVILPVSGHMEWPQQQRFCCISRAVQVLTLQVFFFFLAFLSSNGAGEHERTALPRHWVGPAAQDR